MEIDFILEKIDNNSDIKTWENILENSPDFLYNFSQSLLIHFFKRKFWLGRLQLFY